MATTTNFGWETPDDTDLVKDGAAAMRTLANSIDTSFVDLKGGTTGQVLSKASNTDLDYTWVTTDDANAIQNAIVDAKGDLIAASAADTPARLAVGNNGETLVADSSTSTGLKWARPAMTLIARTSFSAVASQDFDSVFSSAYESYQVVIESCYGSGGQQLYLRFRYGGTDQASGYFGAVSGYTSANNPWSHTSSNTSALSIGVIGNSNNRAANANLIVCRVGNNIEIPSVTLTTANNWDYNFGSGGGTNSDGRNYDGFKLIPGSGNITGTVSIYGLAG